MTRSLRVALWALAGVVVLGIVQKIELREPIKTFVGPFTEPLLLIAQAVLIGALLMWIVAQAIDEHLLPIIVEGFTTLAQTVAVAIETKVGDIPAALRTSLEHSLGDLAQTISPHLVQLAKAGKVSEALAEIETDNEDAKAKPQTEIALLLHSEEQKDWVKASQLLDSNPEAQDPKFYMTLAYRFWTVDQIDRAIEIGERGSRLAMTNKNNDPTHLSKFQNILPSYHPHAQQPP